MNREPERTMGLPRLVITGSSGFLGRHLLDALKEEYEIVGLARRSQARCGAPFHPNIRWYQVDIGRESALRAVFDEIVDDGGAELVIHLAAHYDFSGEEHAEYFRTNVDGLHHVLQQSQRLHPRLFVFSSSVAACAFPPNGGVLDEDSAPDGDHIYARTKALGERMLGEYERSFPSTIVRFAALFSDWCEYPPLYMFLRTWLSEAWNARTLGGRGRSAIPYLHVADAVNFLRRVLDRSGALDPREVLIASPDGATSHRQLYDVVTQYWFEEERSPRYTPRFMVRPGIHLLNLVGRFMRERPFEKPWMASYVDKQMTIDASRTRERLGWHPRERLGLLRRMPFLLENRKADPVEWTRVNRDAMKQVSMRPGLSIHALLQKHQDEIIQRYTDELRENVPRYQDMGTKDHEWNHRVILRHLSSAVRTREKMDFLSYCRDLAERRLDQGFSPRDLIQALEILDRICIETLSEDPEGRDLLPYLYAHLTMTVRFGVDQVRDTCERLRDRYPDLIPDGCEDY
jgi:nucleoside-diphosphate-sugar epimerase